MIENLVDGMDEYDADMIVSFLVFEDGLHTVNGKKSVFCKDKMHKIAKAKCRLLQNIILGGYTPKPL